ncbi:MAG TPA: diguanylate cyclase [Planctomycetaceae bacterium]|nr:diguanylate cyclase [Planctomycetaceae bacterium]
MSVEPKQTLALPASDPDGICSANMLSDYATQNAESVAQLVQSLDQAAGQWESGPFEDVAKQAIVSQPNQATKPSPSPPKTSAAATSIRREAEENCLATAKLGLATSLFFALRSKHPPTASHCLRVALSCSAWIRFLDLNQEERDRIEVAALMHDLGKLGIPDRILRKPGSLSAEERAAISLTPLLGCDILRGCTSDKQLLDIVRYSTSWYDGRQEQRLIREDLPFGARIIAIADAFDSMTSDQVYRPAMSREAAVANLFGGSGVQFDPELTRSFVQASERATVWPPEKIKLSWLRGLQVEPNELPWSAPAIEETFGLVSGAIALAGAVSVDETLDATAATISSRSSFESRDPLLDPLLNSLTEAVIFVDSHGVIRDWNEAAARMTCIAANAVLHNEWRPTILSLMDSEGEDVAAIDCPVATTVRTQVGVSGRYRIERCDGTRVPIDLRSVLVSSKSQGMRGVLLLLQDLSDKSRLESSVLKLQRQVIQDPLTGVANRAEMDRMLAELTAGEGSSFSLVICDIDHFKSVNDVYGHQAGDEALVRVAQLLTSQSRPNDLVCRYGGEEFVVICPEIDVVSATRRAEAIRLAVEETDLSMLDNTHITASFGVTQMQLGDTAESVFARADRALLQAKETGRNQVIQLGVGGVFKPFNVEQEKKSWLSRLFSKSSQESGLKARITTPVPMDLAIEKLRGFLADHKAEVLHVSTGKMQIRLEVAKKADARRSFRSHMSFLIDLKIYESFVESKSSSLDRGPQQQRTTVEVTLTPESGSRRAEDVTACARRAVVGLNCYLIGKLEQE